MTRFAIVGNGWRAMFYVRIAIALPEEFEITAVMFRDREKAKKFQKEYGIFTCLQIEEVKATKPDFIVLSVAKPAIFDMLEKLMRLGIPILAETPPAQTAEEIRRIDAIKKETKADVQVAEQYMFQPMYTARKRALDMGLIGEVESVLVSDAHDYHGVSIIRHILRTEHEKVKILAHSIDYEIVETDSRGGMRMNGEQRMVQRMRAEFMFEGGKIGYYDFSGVQYHSFIRSRFLQICGMRGEILNEEIRYLNAQNQPVFETFTRVMDQHNNSLYRIMLGGRCLYENPFLHVRLNEDEIAVSHCLLKMRSYLSERIDFYPLDEALWDCYLSLRMKEEAKNCSEALERMDFCEYANPTSLE